MMAILFTDIDGQTAQLKKAKSVLALVVDSLPVNEENSECAWAIGAAFDLVHDVINSLDEVVSQQARRIKQGGADA